MYKHNLMSHPVHSCMFAVPLSEPASEPEGLMTNQSDDIMLWSELCFIQGSTHLR